MKISTLSGPFKKRKVTKVNLTSLYGEGKERKKKV